MSQASRQALQTTSTLDIFGVFADGASSLLSKFAAHRRQTRIARVLGELSDAQLADVGIDRQAISPSRPTLEVKAGLMSNLMSMR